MLDGTLQFCDQKILIDIDLIITSWFSFLFCSSICTLQFWVSSCLGAVRNGSPNYSPHLRNFQDQNPNLHLSSSIQNFTRTIEGPDHVSKRDLDKFNSYTPYDHHKDRRSSSHRENRRLHSYRRSPSIERSWKRERRSPSKSKPQRYCCENSRSPRSGSFRCQSGDGSDRNLHRVYGSPIDDGIPPHRRSIDSRKRRERRAASPLEIGRRHRSRDTSVDDSVNDRRDYRYEMIIEPTGTRSRYQSKQTLHGNSQYATSETLNAKAPCLNSVCASNLHDHLPSAFQLPLGDNVHSTKIDHWPNVGNGTEWMTKGEHGLHMDRNDPTNTGLGY